MKGMFLAGLLTLAPMASSAGPDTGHYPYRVDQPVYAHPVPDESYAPRADDPYVLEAFGPDHEPGFPADAYVDGYGPEAYADGYGEPHDPALDGYAHSEGDGYGEEAYADTSAWEDAQAVGGALIDDPYAGEGWYEGVDAYGPYSGRYTWRRPAPTHDNER